MSTPEQILSNIAAAYVDGRNTEQQAQQEKVNALVLACEAALQYLEGCEAESTQDELTEVEKVCAQLHAVLAAARART